MRQLNYRHLQYFWVVAREGSIASASEILHLTPQTISSQLKALEKATGVQLLRRQGRQLVPTPAGETVLEYAEEIFALGFELTEVLAGREAHASRTLVVGIVDSLPKLLTSQILSLALKVDEPPLVRCHEGSMEDLLGELAVRRLDLILSDHTVPEGLPVRTSSQLIGETAVSFFCVDPAAGFAAGFPGSIDGAEVLLPTLHNPLRRRLDEWFARHEVSPYVLAEFDDSALLKAFGQTSGVVFPSAKLIASEITRMYGAEQVGEAEGVFERIYAIAPQQKWIHPAAAEIIEKAKALVFGGS